MTTLQVNSAIARPVSIGSGTLASGQQAVTTTATPLPTGAAGSVSIQNPVGSPQTIFVGNSTVTTANGFALSAGQSVTLSVKNTNLIYLIAAATGATAAWTKTV